MRKTFSTSFLVNTLPIIIVLVVFAVIFDWGNAVKVFFRETKVATQKKYIENIVYDIKIDKIENTSNGKIEDEYILINSTAGNCFHIKYIYDESKKKTNLEEYKNYIIERCIINNDETNKLKDITNGNTTYMKNNTDIPKITGNYYVYVKDKLKKVVSADDNEAMKIIQKIEQESKPVVNM